ncbi:MAG: VOC family protein [Novosphingobium sp.]|nr:VOC family protein [Novosphingobium sp.]
MKRIFGVAAGLVLAATAPQVPAQPLPGPGVIGAKIVVQDFARTIAFYKALGAHAGTRFNPREWQLDWDGSGPNARLIMISDQPGGATRLDRGGGYLMIWLPDLAAVPARLKAAGYTGALTLRPTPQATILMVTDPDGNHLELLGPGAAVPPR